MILKLSLTGQVDAFRDEEGEGESLVSVRVEGLWEKRECRLWVEAIERPGSNLV